MWPKTGPSLLRKYTVSAPKGNPATKIIQIMFMSPPYLAMWNTAQQSAEAGTPTNGVAKSLSHATSQRWKNHPSATPLKIPKLMGPMGEPLLLMVLNDSGSMLLIT